MMPFLFIKQLGLSETGGLLLLSTRSLHFSHGGEGAGEGGEGGEVSVSRRRARRSSQVPEPQLEPWPAEAKAAVPAHAQRMSSLLAADKEFAPCRVERRHAMRGVVRAGRREGVGQRWRKRHARY